MVHEGGKPRSKVVRKYLSEAQAQAGEYSRGSLVRKSVESWVSDHFGIGVGVRVR